MIAYPNVRESSRNCIQCYVLLRYLCCWENSSVSHTGSSGNVELPVQFRAFDQPNKRKSFPIGPWIFLTGTRGRVDLSRKPKTGSKYWALTVRTKKDNKRFTAFWLSVNSRWLWTNDVSGSPLCLGNQKASLDVRLTSLQTSRKLLHYYPVLLCNRCRDPFS